MCFLQVCQGKTLITHNKQTSSNSIETIGFEERPTVSMTMSFDGSLQVTNHGRLYTSRGKPHPDMMYSGGCIYVDHPTGFIHIEHMINFTATETIQSKRRFEKKLLDMGVLVQSYQSDNGIFTSSDFMEEVNKGLQNITFIGVGTHHQNRIAERGIQSILTKARTLLIHAAI